MGALTPVPSPVRGERGDQLVADSARRCSEEG